MPLGFPVVPDGQQQCAVVAPDDRGFEIACLMRGLETYSDTDDGALYRFSWIFPRSREGGGIGEVVDGNHLKLA